MAVNCPNGTASRLLKQDSYDLSRSEFQSIFGGGNDENVVRFYYSDGETSKLFPLEPGFCDLDLGSYEEISNLDILVAILLAGGIITTAIQIIFIYQKIERNVRRFLQAARVCACVPPVSPEVPPLPVPIPTEPDPFPDVPDCDDGAPRSIVCFIATDTTDYSSGGGLPNPSFTEGVACGEASVSRTTTTSVVRFIDPGSNALGVSEFTESATVTYLYVYSGGIWQVLDSNPVTPSSSPIYLQIVREPDPFASPIGLITSSIQVVSASTGAPIGSPVPVDGTTSFSYLAPCSVPPPPSEDPPPPPVPLPDDTYDFCEDFPDLCSDCPECPECPEEGIPIRPTNLSLSLVSDCQGAIANSQFTFKIKGEGGDV